MTTQTTCNECGKVRTEDDHEYMPVQILTGDIGWHSDKDGNLCGGCMTAIIRKANLQ